LPIDEKLPARHAGKSITGDKGEQAVPEAGVGGTENNVLARGHIREGFGVAGTERKDFLF
jgi:hypothetical protein